MRLVLLVAGIAVMVALAIPTAASARQARSWTHLSLTERRTMVTQQISKERTTVRWWIHNRQKIDHGPVHVCRAIGITATSPVCLAGQRLVHALRFLRERLTPPTIAHEALWLCIHSGEGSWTDGGYPYYGGLQMSYGWEGLVSDASRLSPFQQMRAAEIGYARNSYSRYWLTHQWPRSSLSCLKFA